MADKKEEPKKKRSPNRLLVDEATNDDNSVIALSTAKMDRNRPPINIHLSG